MQNTLRQSPSGRVLGAFGSARLTLSADLAYVVPATLDPFPWDQVEFWGPEIGELLPSGIFRVTRAGLYVVQFLIASDVSPIVIEAGVVSVAQGVLVASDPGRSTASAAGSAVAVAAQEFRTSAGVITTSGNISAGNSNLLIHQIG